MARGLCPDMRLAAKMKFGLEKYECLDVSIWFGMRIFCSSSLRMCLFPDESSRRSLVSCGPSRVYLWQRRVEPGSSVKCGPDCEQTIATVMDDVIVLECPYAVCPFHSPALITLNPCDESVSPNKFSSPSPLHYPDPPGVPRVSQSKIRTPDEYKCFHLLRPTPPLQQLQGKFNKAFISRLNTSRSIKHRNHFLSKSQSVFDHRIGIMVKCTV